MKQITKNVYKQISYWHFLQRKEKFKFCALKLKDLSV